MAMERIRREREMLQRVEKEKEALEFERVRASATFDLARIQLHQVTTELARVQGLWEQLSASIARCQKEILSIGMDALPEEMLRAVFEAVVESAGHWSSEDDAEIQLRTQTPYVLSSVCKHWRTVALDLHTLWSYIALPGFAGHPDQHARVLADTSLRLERSRSTPLDIVVAWAGEGDIGVPHDTALALLAPHHSRWRRFKFIGPDKCHWPLDSRRIFTLPAPGLEEVYISQPHLFRMALDEGPFDYFPDRRRLRRFDCVHSDFLWTNPTPFGAITSLTFGIGRTPLSAFRAVLEAAAPTLEFLEIVGGPMLTRAMLIDDNTRRAPITMPRLVSFTGRLAIEEIFCPPLAAKIAAPLLETLVLHDVEFDALTGFLATTCATVTSLDVEDGIRIGFQATSLRALTHVRHLVLGDCEIGELDFMTSLARPLHGQPDSWLFPELRSIAFSGIEQTPPGWTDSVRDMVHQRNRAAADGRDGAPAKVESVQFVNCENVNEVDRRLVETEVNRTDF
ncbi:hypothetical protein AURDEDRAFT_187611 [Auricularia subglabra TFB-10046 SS5]|nr:hypothetical protein AURDEDRAFT_187611 [Auricularia subglabra TFB-10046 SS5]